MKIIIGAGKTKLTGWLSTQESELDLLKEKDFEKILKCEKAEAFLAEHVWEHLTLEEGVLAAKNCYKYLCDGGYVRIAVPDRNFRNALYQDLVKVGGNGDPMHPAYSHKIVYDYKTISKVFEDAGFEVELLEYCDESGNFHYKYWNESDGKIGRSFRFDTRNSDNTLGMVSIVLDAKKKKIIKFKDTGEG